MRKRLFTGDHPYVASSLNNLALLYNYQGRYDQAEPLYIEALAMKKRLFTGDHPDVVLSLNNLALLYNNQGRYDQAELLYQEALKIAELSLGVNHPSTITIRENFKSLSASRRSKLVNVVSFVKRFFSSRGNRGL